jgi:hypothetical protein
MICPKCGKDYPFLYLETSEFITPGTIVDIDKSTCLHCIEQHKTYQLVQLASIDGDVCTSRMIRRNNITLLNGNSTIFEWNTLDNKTRIIEGTDGIDIIKYIEDNYS